MKPTKRSAIIVIIIITGLVAAAVFSVKWLNNENNHRIFISGNIELTEVNIAFKNSGRIIELNIEEGDPVKKGMIIARLDQEQLLLQRDRFQAMLDAARVQCSKIQTEIQYQYETLKGNTALRKAEMNQAGARLKELLSGSRAQEIEQMQAMTERAKAEFEKAKKDWERAKILYDKGDISTARYDQVKTAYESAEAGLKQAREQLALVVEGPREENIEAARAQVAAAKAGLQITEAQRLEIKRKEQDLELAQTDIKRAITELALIESQLKDNIAESPIDGVVLTKAAEAGEIIPAGAPIVTIGDLYHPWLRGYINEENLDRVKLGGKARIITDSGKIFWGRISFISSEAEFTPKQIQTKQERVKLVYRIKISIENPNGELKLNMPADAEILMDS
ncbi:efflux RND transporter periplasmic adaptor subunit [bacterium]|nr:efflux RND transporter periplasmic adaptor subunit [bacterium]